MATRPRQQWRHTDEPQPLRAPPPVPDGIGYRDSLGKWIDRLTGADRDREAVSAYIAQLVDDNEPPADPPPSEAPPPLPDGTQTVTRGAKPARSK